MKRTWLSFDLIFIFIDVNLYFFLKKECQVGRNVHRKVPFCFGLFIFFSRQIKDKFLARNEAKRTPRSLGKKIVSQNSNEFFKKKSNTYNKYWSLFFILVWKWWKLDRFHWPEAWDENWGGISATATEPFLYGESFGDRKSARRATIRS